MIADANNRMSSGRNDFILELIELMSRFGVTFSVLENTVDKDEYTEGIFVGPQASWIASLGDIIEEVSE